MVDVVDYVLTSWRFFTDLHRRYCQHAYDLAVSGSGELQAEMELTDTLDAELSGSGDIHLKGKFPHLKNHVSGSGNALLDMFVTQADFNISGSGKIKASGNAQNVTASINGSGDLSAANLTADTYRLRITGSGNALIAVKSALDASIAGSGDIIYKGNPLHVSTHKSGSGNVKKID